MYKVLLVDDEPYVIEGLKTMGEWEKYGFRICGEASNGEDALEIMAAADPDLVFTDIRMPAKDGLQLIRQAREEWAAARTKFVILSGYDDFAYVQSAMRYEVSDYLLKPIDDEELNAVISHIGEQIQAEDRERAGLDQRTALLAQGLVQRILKGERRDALLTEARDLLNLGAAESLRCILIEIDHYASWPDRFTAQEIRSRKDDIKAAIAAGSAEELRWRLLETAGNHFCLIAAPGMTAFDQPEAFITATKAALHRRCPGSVSVAVSEILPGLESLAQLYQQALTALNHKFFAGEGSVLYHGDLKALPLSHDYAHPAARIERLLEDIRHHQREGLARRIEELFQDFERQRCAPEVIKATIKTLGLEAIKLIADRNGDAAALSERFTKFSAQLDDETLGRLKADFSRFCADLEEYRFTSGPNGSAIIQEIKRFVKENYHQDLNLQKLAKEFYMNPAYLGQLFKKHTGLQYSEYLHQIRSEEAKKLLRRTNMKITEIAQAVGYHDPDYFVSKFKAIAGVAPSEFRKGLGK